MNGYNIDVTKAYATYMFNNTLKIMCFTLLALAFKQWWIVLFSLLFLSSFKANKKTEEVKEDE